MPQEALDYDFTQICRVCLEANKVFVDIYTNFCVKNTIWYAEMLTNCTTIRPYQEDGLPRLICKECCRQLKRTHTFVTLCKESDQKLRCYLETKGQQNYLVQEPVVKDEENKEEIEIDCNNFQNGDTCENDMIDFKNCTDLNHTHENNEDIKVEPGYTDGMDDSGWDAEDDNVALIQVKSTRRGKGANPKSSDEHPKKKRGRKKKENAPISVYGEGETPSLPESKLPHQCDICGKLLSTKSNLNAHKICHTDLRPYKCTECPASFKGHSALFQHKKAHSGETPFHCEFCPKQFSRRYALLNHIRMHNDDRQYSCEICLKTFVQSAQLNIHMKRHKGDKSFLCQDCGKGFPIKSDLKVHQRIHNGERPYACHLCTKTFATSGNLSIHVRIHNKEVRYNCSVCARGFVTCSAYNVHMKRHKGQRDYHCECGKTFYTSSALKQHKVVHTGEKKYQCKICERKFTQTSHLSRHFKRDHAKPNMPVPPSEHYKLVITQTEGYNIFGTINVEKADNPGLSSVKCEGT